MSTPPPTADAPAGRVGAVCVVHRLLPTARDDVASSAIDKRPVTGPVPLKRLGLEGDVQCDSRHHGGPDQAVYAYSQRAAEIWAAELGRDVPPGAFGENLRITGLDVDAAPVGQRWRIGEVAVVEVTRPRVPCATFAGFVDEPRWVRRFTERGLFGAYLRVLTPGPVAAGDPVTVLATPAHGVPVSRLHPAPTPAELAALVAEAAAGSFTLAGSVAEQARRVLGGTVGPGPVTGPAGGRPAQGTA